MCDHLGQQRVEAGAGAVAAVAEAVGAHAGAGGRVVGGDQPARRPHLAGGRDRLHVDAGLDRVAAGRRGGGVGQADVGQRLAPGDAQLRLHQVDAGDRLRDRVLDLQPGVGLDEEEGRVLTHPRGVDQELEGAEVVVADVAGEAHGRVRDAVAQVGGQVGRRRDLDDLLVAALYRAFAFAHVGDGAVPVAHDLHLDVTRARQVLLDVQGAVAEGARCLRAAALERLGQLAGVLDGAGAAPAAAGQRLEHDRAAYAQAGQELGRLRLRDRAVDAGDGGHVRLGRRRAGAALVAEQLQVRDARSDERDARVRAGARQGGVLGQEAVAGVDRVAAGGHGRRDDRLNVEVGRHAAGVEPDRLVGDARVQRLGVVLRVHGHAADAEVGRRAGDANRDLAAVGDQQAANGHGTSPGRRFRRLRESLAARPPADGQPVGAARYAPSSMAVANVTWNGTQ